MPPVPPHLIHLGNGNDSRQGAEPAPRDVVEDRHDFLDKPVSHGGLDLSRPLASAVIAAIIVVLLILLPQRPGRNPGEKKVARR